MFKMTFERALGILGLNRDYNSDELKKAYRKLAMEWHPDHHKDPSGEKFKEINEAYQLLSIYKDNVESRPYVNYVNYLALYKKQAINLIRSYVEDMSNFKTHELYNDIFKCNSLMRTLVDKYIPMINSANTEFELEVVIQGLDKEYENVLKQLYDSFIDRYPYIKSLDYKIDFDLKISVFVNRLYDIKKDAINKLSKKLKDSTISKYELYSGYGLLENDILKIVDDTVNKIFMSDSSKEDSILKNMYNDIELLFKNSFDFQIKSGRIDALYRDARGIDSFILRMKIDELSTDFSNDYFHSQADLIAKSIKSISSGTYIKDIYSHLVFYYNECLKYINPIEDENHIKKALSIFNRAISILCSYKEGILNYDILSYLFGVKFEDLEQDEKVLDFVSNRSDIFNPGYVYVSKSSISPFASVYMLDSGYQYRVKDVNNIRTKNIRTSADISKNYVSLSLALANAEFIGKRARSISGNYISILYRYLDRYFVLDTNNDITMYSVEGIRIIDKEAPELECYKDKRLVLSKISERVKNELPYKTLNNRKFY